MNLNPDVRTNRLETLLNAKELNAFDALCKAIGVSRSTRSRELINKDVESHRTAIKPAKESRGCPGPGHVASRSKVVRGAVSGRRAW